MKVTYTLLLLCILTACTTKKSQPDTSPEDSLSSIHLIASQATNAAVSATMPAANVTPATIPPPVVAPETSNFWVYESQLHCFAIDKAFDTSASQELALPGEQPGSIWPRVQSGLSFQYINNRAVRAQFNWYLKNPDYLQRVQLRAKRYIYHVVDQLEQQQMPLDLALLPIIESAYEPFAFSHGKAAGLWQFVPVTGKRFKLQQDWWVDERRAPVQSTQAALKYLKRLHRYFDDDWLLAIAAYNSGEGKVRRAIRKNRARGLPTDFWHLDLPAETSAYVPQILALSRIFRDPKKYGINLEAIEDAPYFADVELTQPMEASVIASLAGISRKEFYYLNAELNRGLTPPVSRYTINLPVDKISRFNKAMAEYEQTNLGVWTQYNIQSGDTLGMIALQHATDVELIKNANQLPGNQIYPGNTLLLPSPKLVNRNALLQQHMHLAIIEDLPEKEGFTRTLHRVRSGDSFWSIAKHYRIRIYDLAEWNNKSVEDTLIMGEKLAVWKKDS